MIYWFICVYNNFKKKWKFSTEQSKNFSTVIRQLINFVENVKTSLFSGQYYLFFFSVFPRDMFELMLEKILFFVSQKAILLWGFVCLFKRFIKFLKWITFDGTFPFIFEEGNSGKEIQKIGWVWMKENSKMRLVSKRISLKRSSRFIGVFKY